MLGRNALFYMGFCVAVAGAAVADDWRVMSGDEIRTALNGVALDYGNATQTFDADGRTTYVAGRPSQGSWDVRGDQYCSVWPPSETWVCYDMFQKPGMLRFVGESGTPTDGVIVER